MQSFMYLLIIFVEITLRAIQVTTLHKSWWGTAWYIFSCRLSWFQGLCSCHCLLERSLESLKEWLWLCSLPQQELLHATSYLKWLDVQFSPPSGLKSWNSSRLRFVSTSHHIGFDPIYTWNIKSFLYESTGG